MPVLASTYEAPWFLRNGHLQTVYPALKRRVTGFSYTRTRLELKDGDFLDLDISNVQESKRGVLLAHGLEGCSERAYMRGMVRAFNRRGWNAFALNFRGCSGEPNRLLRFYHSGVSEDLLQAAEFVHTLGVEQLMLVGFSLGGNVVLKLLGEWGKEVPAWVLGGVAISVPSDLKSSATVMLEPQNRVYMDRFLKDLREKIRLKQSRFPELLDDSGYESIRGFKDFDDRYTAPIHGFKDAEDYWARCSSRFFVDRIARPTLLLNALDDPFLTPLCFPEAAAQSSRFFHLEAPSRGGHVGFVGGGLMEDEYYSERRAIEFAQQCEAEAASR